MQAKTIKKLEKAEKLFASGKMSRHAALKKCGVYWTQWKRWSGGTHKPSTKASGKASKRLVTKKNGEGLEKVVHPSGATRHALPRGVRFDLISPYGLERLAQIYDEGAKAHGDRNWEAGLPVSDVLNRCMRHLNLRLKGDRSEDHVAKAAWGLFAIMEFEATQLHCVDIPRWHQAPEKEA